MFVKHYDRVQLAPGLRGTKGIHFIIRYNIGKEMDLPVDVLAKPYKYDDELTTACTSTQFVDWAKPDSKTTVYLT